MVGIDPQVFSRLKIIRRALVSSSALIGEQLRGGGGVAMPEREKLRMLGISTCLSQRGWKTWL